MAHPRVFISSTYYDLKNVRADLERYIKDRGFDPVLNERGQIPYGNEEKLEEYCYREIENCDILVSIIGGRHGSSSSHDPYSISHQQQSGDSGRRMGQYSRVAKYHSLESCSDRHSGTRPVLLRHLSMESG